MLKFGTPTIALPLAIKNVLFRLDALYMLCICGFGRKLAEDVSLNYLNSNSF